MKSIKTLDEINKISNEKAVYVRWSRGPEKDKAQKVSMDHSNRTLHNGLSCQRVYYDNWKMPLMLVEYEYLRRKDSKIFGWIFTAEENGTDSDGAPTVNADSISPIGKLDKTLVEKLSDYNELYWDWVRNGFQGEKPEQPK